MGKRGPLKAPDSIRSITGSRTPVPIDGITCKPLDVVPDIPKWINNDDAIEFWNEMVPVMVVNGLLSQLHVNAFAHLCMLHGALLEHYKSNIIPGATLVAQYVSLSDKMGLTLAGASRIKMPEKPKGNNPFLHD